FTRLSAYQLIAELGYRARDMDRTLQDLLNDVDVIVGAGIDDIATSVAALELGTKLADDRLIAAAIQAARRKSSAVTQCLPDHYREYAFPFNRIAAGVSRRVLRHLTKP